MTTYQELIATGRGSLVYLLEITGLGVFTTFKYTPTDGWFTDADYTASRVYPWLQWDSLPAIREQVTYLESDIDVGAMRLIIADIGGGFTALAKGYLARVWTRLTETLSETDVVSASVLGSSGWAAGGGFFYVGQESIEYDSKTATT